MRIVIIEDEPFTAEDLAADLHKLRPAWKVIALLGSVAASKEWLAKDFSFDLIFSDIQLGDGNCFDIFEAHPPKAPIIFCTAFDQFAIQAFQSNGVGYLLKPYSMENLGQAIEKVERLRPAPMPIGDLRAISELSRPQQSRLLVYQKDKIIPIDIAEIALFFVHHELTKVICLDGHVYHLTQTLGELEALAGSGFFRASRQHLLSRKAIRSVTPQLSRKLQLDLNVQFDEEVTVSKEKVPIFLEWLEEKT